MKTSTITNAPRISVKRNRIVANSLDVADYLGISHTELVEEIEAEIRENPDAAEYTEQVPCVVIVGSDYRNLASFDMTADAVHTYCGSFWLKHIARRCNDYVAAMHAAEDAIAPTIKWVEVA